MLNLLDVCLSFSFSICCCGVSPSNLLFVDKMPPKMGRGESSLLCVPFSTQKPPSVPSAAPYSVSPILEIMSCTRD